MKGMLLEEERLCYTSSMKKFQTDESVRNVYFGEHMFPVDLYDGRTITVPIACFRDYSKPYPASPSFPARVSRFAE